MFPKNFLQNLNTYEPFKILNKIDKKDNLTDSFKYVIPSTKNCFLNNIILNVNIPYFFLEKIDKISNEISKEDLIYSSLLHNDKNTYLIFFNSKYYLIPNYNFDITNYELSEIRYYKIKSFINSKVKNTIDNNQIIYFYKYNLNKLKIKDNLINILLQNSNYIDKKNLEYIINSETDLFNKNLISNITFQNYTSNIIDNIFYKNYNLHYQLIQSDLTFNYSEEIRYYNFLINNNPPIDSITNNLTVSLYYKNLVSVNEPVNQSQLKLSLIETNNVVQFILNNFLKSKYFLTIYNNNNQQIIEELQNNFNTFINENLVQISTPFFNNFKATYLSFNNNQFNLNMDDFSENNKFTIWKKLKTIQNRFKDSTISNINFTNYNEYINELKTINLAYTSIPTDTTNRKNNYMNIYVLVLIEFLKLITDKKIFLDNNFINIYVSKIICFLYLRFNRLGEELTNTETIFYFKLDFNNIFQKKNLIYELKSLFLKKSFIGILPIQSDLNTLTLQTTNFTETTSGLSNSSILNVFYDLKVTTEYNIDDYEFDNTNMILSLNTNKINLGYQTSYFIKDLSNQILDCFVEDEIVKFKLEKIIENNFTLIEEKNISIPLVKTDNLGNNNNFVTYDLFNSDINNFVSPNKFNLNIDNFSENDTTYLNYKKTGTNFRIKVKLTKFDNGFITNIFKNFKKYESVILEYYKLPYIIQKIEDSICYDINTKTIGVTGCLKKYYPKIYLSKSKINESTFTKLKSYKILEKNVRIINNTSDYLELEVLDSNILDKDTLELKIFNNENLPNIHSFTSLGNVNDVMDYFVQQPFFIQLNSTNNLPIYVFQNLPYYNKTTKIFFKNLEIDNVYNLNSNQILRSETDLISTHFDTINYKDKKSENKIQEEIVNELNTILDKIEYKIFLDNIDIIQSEYINIYKKYFSSIKNGIYGDTIKNIFNNLKNIKDTFDIKDIYFNTNQFTNYAIGLNTFNNLLYDSDITLTNLVVFNSPYLRKTQDIILEKIIIDYLGENQVILKNQLKFYESRNQYLNFSNNFTINYGNLSDYYQQSNTNLLEINPITIKFKNNSKYLENIDNTNIVVFDEQNNKIDTTIDNKIVSTSSLNITYDNEETYNLNETINSFNNLSKNYYNFIGFVNILNSGIVFNKSYETLFTDIKYLSDDMLKIYTSETINTLHGVHSNCKKLNVVLKENITINKISSDIYFYTVEFKNSELSNFFNYYVKINESIGCARIESDKIVMIFNKLVNINLGDKIFYEKTFESNLNILNKISKQISNINFYDNFKLLDLKIFSIQKNNYYSTSLVNGNIFLTHDSKLISSKYNGYSKFNNLSLFLVDKVSKSQLEVNINYVNETLLPPLLFEKKLKIFLFDSSILKNIDHWFMINNKEFQLNDIKDIDNGNYKLYYCPSSTKPNILKNENYIEIFKKLTNINKIIFNPYESKLILDNNISDNIDKTTIEILGNKYLVDNYSEKIINFKKEPSILTNLVFEDLNNIIFIRPLTLSSSKPTINFKFKINDLNSDSLFVIDNITNNHYLTNLIFTNNFDLSLINNNSLVKITKINSKNFKINLRNIELIEKNKFYKIKLFVSANNVTEEIIIWFIYSISYKNINLLQNNKLVTEPFFIDFNKPSIISVSQFNTSYYLYEYNDIFPISDVFEVRYYDSKYFKINKNDLLETISKNEVKIRIVKNNLKTIENIEPNEKILYKSLNYYKINKTNFWNLIGTYSIYNNNIKDINNVFEKDKYIILISDDKLYYNEIISHTNGLAKLKYKLDFEKVDVYTYKYNSFFVENFIMYFNKFDQSNIIHLKCSNLEIYQIILVNDIPIYINDYSYYDSSFIGIVLGDNIKIQNGSSNGYYNLGLLTNINYRNNIFKNNIDLFSFKTTDTMTVGDYIIDNKNLKIFNDNNIDNLVFKSFEGITINLIYLSGTDNYYIDKNFCKLKENDIIVVEYNDIKYILRIKTVDNNIIKFYNNSITISKDSKLKAYYPFQPFISKKILVTDNKIDILNFTGWIELYTTDWEIIRVEKSILQKTIENNNYLCRLFNEKSMFINSDFRSSLNIVDNTIDELNHSICSYIKLENDTNDIYFQFKLNKINLRYNSSVVINNYVYKVVRIIESNNINKIFINRNVGNIELNLNEEYKILFSRDDINKVITTSNNLKIQNVQIIKYPKINTTNSSLLIIKKNTDFKYSMEKQNIILDSDIITNLEDSNFNINYIYFLDSYIPIKITLVNNTYKYTKINFKINDNENYILEEVDTVNRKFLHLIKITKTNNLYKVISKNIFVNSKSKFYLNRIIPIKIVNNYIEILYPNIKFHKKIPSMEEKIFYFRIKIPIILINDKHIVDKNNKYKYEIKNVKSNFSYELENSFDILKNEKILILEVNNDNNYIIKEDNKFYIYSDKQLINNVDFIYVNKKNIVKALEKENKTFLNLYSNFNENTNKIKLAEDTLFGTKDTNIYLTNQITLKSQLNNLNEFEAFNLNLNYKYEFIYPNLSKYIVSNVSDNNYSIILDRNLSFLTNDTNYNIYFNNNDDKKYLFNEKISTTLSDTFNVLNFNKTDNKFIFNIKPWNIWTLYIDTSFLNKGSICYKNNIFTVKIDDSYFTNEEIIKIQNYLKFIKDKNYFNVMKNLREIENFLYNRIIQLIDEPFFWHNIVQIINELVDEFNKNTNENKWIILNKCLVTYNNFKYEDASLFNLQNGIFTRNNYLTNDFNVKFEDDEYIVLRDSTKVFSEFSSLISKDTVSNIGFSFDTFYGKLLEIKDMKNNIDTTNINLSINNNSLKYYINTLWTRKFNQSNIVNSIDYEEIHPIGKYYTLEFNEIYYRHKKIIKDVFYKDAKVILDYTNLYNYILSISDVTFNSTIKYKLNNIEVKDSEVNLTNININTKNEINTDNVELFAKKNYTISNIENYGLLHEIEFNKNINSDVEYFYFDNKLLLIKDINLNKKILTLPIQYNDEKNSFKIVLKNIIISELNLVSNKYIINFKNKTAFSNFYEDEEVYIKDSNNEFLYLVKKENSDFYVDSQIDISNNYSFFKIIKVNTIIPSDNYYYEITLEKNITNKLYDQPDINLPQTFSIENKNIIESKIILNNVVSIKSPDIIDQFDKIYHNFFEGETIPYIVESLINKNIYIYKVLGKFFYTENSLFELFFSDTDKILINLLNNNISPTELIFTTSKYFLITKLNKYKLKIKNSYNLKILKVDKTLITTEINENFNLSFKSLENNVYVNDSLVSIKSIDVVDNKYNIILENEILNPINSIKLEQIQEYNMNDTKYDMTRENNNSIFELTTTFDLDNFNTDSDVKLKYSNKNKNYSENIYSFDFLSEDIIDFGDFIYLNDEKKNILSKVVDVYFNNNIYTFRIDTNLKLDLTNNFNFISYDFKYKQNILLKEEDNIYGIGKIFKIINSKKIELLLDNNRFSTYVNNNKYGFLSISFKNSKFNIKNTNSNLSGFSKKPNNVTIENITNKQNINIEWDEELPFKIFKSISFFINNKLIEKLDYDIYNIVYSYYYKKKVNEIKRLTKIKKNNDNSISFILPIPFFFNRNNFKLPIHSLGNSQILIQFNLEKLSNLVKNNLNNFSLSSQFNVNLQIYKSELQFSEKIIKKNLEMKDYLINVFDINKTLKIDQVLKFDTKFLTRDMFWKINDTFKETNIIDIWFSNFQKDQLIYLNYKQTNQFKKEDISNILLFSDIEDEINEGKSSRVQVCTSNSLLKKYNLTFLLYLDLKYLFYLKNDWDKKVSVRVKYLVKYLQNIHVNKVQFEKNKDVTSIDIFKENKPITYFNKLDYFNIVSSFKSGNKLKDNYYLYSFNFDSRDSQPNGSTNSNSNINFKIKSNNNSLNFKFITNDYKILRVAPDVGIGGLLQ